MSNFATKWISLTQAIPNGIAHILSTSDKNKNKNSIQMFKQHNVISQYAHLYAYKYIQCAYKCVHMCAYLYAHISVFCLGNK